MPALVRKFLRLLLCSFVFVLVGTFAVGHAQELAVTRVFAERDWRVSSHGKYVLSAKSSGQIYLSKFEDQGYRERIIDTRTNGTLCEVNNRGDSIVVFSKESSEIQQRFNKPTCELVKYDSLGNKTVLDDRLMDILESCECGNSTIRLSEGGDVAWINVNVSRIEVSPFDEYQATIHFTKELKYFDWQSNKTYTLISEPNSTDANYNLIGLNEPGFSPEAITFDNRGNFVAVYTARSENGSTETTVFQHILSDGQTRKIVLNKQIKFLDTIDDFVELDGVALVVKEGGYYGKPQRVRVRDIRNGRYVRSDLISSRAKKLQVQGNKVIRLLSMSRDLSCSLPKNDPIVGADEVAIVGKPGRDSILAEHRNGLVLIKTKPGRMLFEGEYCPIARGSLTGDCEDVLNSKAFELKGQPDNTLSISVARVNKVVNGVACGLHLSLLTAHHENIPGVGILFKNYGGSEESTLQLTTDGSGRLTIPFRLGAATCYSSAYVTIPFNHPQYRPITFRISGPNDPYCGV